MQEIKQFFINIERTDINESMENLVSEDFIDSIDIVGGKIKFPFGKIKLP